MQTLGTSRSRIPRSQRIHLWVDGEVKHLGLCFGYGNRIMTPTDGDHVTCQIDSSGSVGKSGPGLSALHLVMVLPVWKPLDHHEERHRAVFQQAPGQRDTGAVDNQHMEVLHTVAFRKTKQRGGTGGQIVTFNKKEFN